MRPWPKIGSGPGAPRSMLSTASRPSTVAIEAGQLRAITTAGKRRVPLTGIIVVAAIITIIIVTIIIVTIVVVAVIIAIVAVVIVVVAVVIVGARHGELVGNAEMVGQDRQEHECEDDDEQTKESGERHWGRTPRASSRAGGSVASITRRRRQSSRPERNRQARATEYAQAWTSAARRLPLTEHCR